MKCGWLIWKYSKIVSTSTIAKYVHCPNRRPPHYHHTLKYQMQRGLYCTTTTTTITTTHRTHCLSKTKTFHFQLDETSIRCITKWLVFNKPQKLPIKLIVSLIKKRFASSKIGRQWMTFCKRRAQTKINNDNDKCSAVVCVWVWSSTPPNEAPLFIQFSFSYLRKYLWLRTYRLFRLAVNQMATPQLLRPPPQSIIWCHQCNDDDDDEY